MKKPASKQPHNIVVLQINKHALRTTLARKIKSCCARGKKQKKKKEKKGTNRSANDGRVTKTHVTPIAQQSTANVEPANANKGKKKFSNTHNNDECNFKPREVT
jgi:N-acetylmuramoyl-L-alanine amidase CwlA